MRKRVIEQARYAVGVAIIGGVSVVGITALGLCVWGVMTATLISPRAARLIR